MQHPILDLTNNLNWDSVIREGWQRTTGSNGKPIKIPDKEFTVDKHLFLIGCKSIDAPNHWIRGCYASQLFFTIPTSFQPQFPSYVQGEKAHFIPLNVFTLVRFPDYGVNPYKIKISIPKWHDKFYLEIWKYSGVDSDSVEQSLLTIQNKVLTL